MKKAKGSDTFALFPLAPFSFSLYHVGRGWVALWTTQSLAGILQAQTLQHAFDGAIELNPPRLCRPA